MMSCMPLETYWAFNKRLSNKFCYTVASCWLFLLIHTTMHGSMNINLFFIVPTHALHYTLISHFNLTLKHLKFAPTCFGLLWNHLQGVHGRTSSGYRIGMLIYICYKECRSVCGCMSIHSVIDTQPHTDTFYNDCKSTFQFSNLTKYGHGPPEDGFKGDRNM